MRRLTLMLVLCFFVFTRALWRDTVLVPFYGSYAPVWKNYTFCDGLFGCGLNAHLMMVLHNASMVGVVAQDCCGTPKEPDPDVYFWDGISYVGMDGCGNFVVGPEYCNNATDCARHICAAMRRPRVAVVATVPFGVRAAFALWQQQQEVTV